jgi:hypothetical protein
MNEKVLLCALALAGMTSASTADPIRFLNDTRRCSAAFGGNGAGSTWQDRPFAYQEYEGGVSIQPINGLETWVGQSRQTSSMNSHLMTLSATAQGTVTGTPTSHVYAQGQANFDVWFAADHPANYTMSGFVTETGNQQSAATVTLADENGVAIQTVASAPGAPNYFNLQGDLAPGIYHLAATILGRAQIPPGLASNGSAACTILFSATSSQDCPADWNRDGALDSRDFYAFTNDFMGGNADFNQSGHTDTLDFYDFLAAYFTGCQ